MEKIITLEDVSFSYGEINAINDLNLSVDKGDLVVLMGANGCGKTTLFKLLDGIIKPKNGKIFFKDKEYKYTSSFMKELRQHIGIVFQNSDIQLFCSTVKEDIAYGLEEDKLSKDEIKKLVSNIAEKLGLSELLDRQINELSFGQKKRVALAGILITSPEIIILDEPTAGLDPQGCEEFINTVMEIKKENDLTVLISSHNLDFCVEHFEKFILMDEGRINGSGDIRSIFSSEAFKESRLTLPNIARLSKTLTGRFEFINTTEAERYFKSLDR